MNILIQCAIFLVLLAVFISVEYLLRGDSGRLSFPLFAVLLIISFFAPPFSPISSQNALTMRGKHSTRLKAKIPQSNLPPAASSKTAPGLKRRNRFRMSPFP